MTTPVSQDRRRYSPRKGLAACVASVFALAAPACATAANWIVSSCDQGNSGDLPTKTGTLRFAIANAANSGDTIDMTALPCSTISLQTGAITINKSSMTLLGPGMNALTIEAKYGTYPNSHYDFDRVFNHTGTGSLKIYDLGVSKGYLINNAGIAKGGCIYSAGTLIMYRVKVTNCQAKTDSGAARGGGLYAANGIFFNYGVIGGLLASNVADGGATGSAAGGAIYTKNLLSLKYSTVSYNSANAKSPASAFGGAISTTGTVFIGSSTIAKNNSQGNLGAIDNFDMANSASNTLFIGNSTISGNTASNVIGGVYTNSKTVHVYNSTIAFNTAGFGKLTDYFAPGLAIAADTYSEAIKIESSILSENTYDGGLAENDLSVAFNDIAIAGSDNLIRFSSVLSADLPANTQVFSCPLLGPLRDNGGLTPTHALASKSPAIDAGNINGKVPLTGLAYPNDQRGSQAENGTANYLRVSGPIGDLTPIADMGAFEVQQDNIVFNSSFEGCSPQIF